MISYERDWLRPCACALALASNLVACGDGEARTLLEPEPGERDPGGDTTNTLLGGSNAFITPAANISAEHESQFFTGNSFFNQAWVQAPSSTTGRDGLGPFFNARSCAACHFKDGRGRPPIEEDEEFLGLLLRLSIPGEEPGGAAVPDPNYGGQLQPFSVPGITPEGRPKVRYQKQSGEYQDGTSYELLVPEYSIDELAYGELHEELRISPRVAPAMIGLGLLEAISLADLEAQADPEDMDGDGISGRINQVPDVATGEVVAGRFGWKSEQPSVRQQSAGAFLGDIGISSPLFTGQDCTDVQVDCRNANVGGEPELSEELLDRVATYGRLLAVPARTNWRSDEVLYGKALFFEAGCENCHKSRYVTGEVDGMPELSGQVIFPYTDLLLHDMGEALSDERPSFLAEGKEWRTPPLWGLGRYETVNGHERLLHDGRARGVAEAILWHGGEAEASREFFKSLPEADRELLVKFVRSL